MLRQVMAIHVDEKEKEYCSEEQTQRSKAKCHTKPMRRRIWSSHAGW